MAGAPVTPPQGYTLIQQDVLPSTNDEAGRLAAHGAADGTVVWARRQSAGRGRRGRDWQSPVGNLYCSVLMRPAVPMARAAGLSFVAAVAVGDTVAGFLPADARVEYKWPNDVLVSGAKVAGILLEASAGPGGSADWVVIGCGVNVAADPAVAGQAVTTLAREAGRAVLVEDVLVALLESLRRWRGRWDTQGFGPVREAWLARARGLGRNITVRLPREELHGRFDGLDESGALLLRLPDATRRTISAGDVYFDEKAEGG